MIRYGATCAVLCVLIVEWPTESGGARNRVSQEDEVAKRMASGGPKEWQQEVDRLKEAGATIVRCLSTKVVDKDVSLEDRRAAVYLLASIGNDRALEFLIDHADLRMPLKDYRHDDDLLKEHPCSFALTQIGWKVIPALLERSRANRSEKEAETLAGLLERICRKDLAKTMVADRFNRTGDEKLDEKDALRRVMKVLEK